MRKETDSMGQMDVPESALYGASTQRADQKFSYFGIPSESRCYSCIWFN